MSFLRTGYVIRIGKDGRFWYWTGAYKESKWTTSFYLAKIYQTDKRAQTTVDDHKEEDYTGLWELAKVVKLKIQED